MKLGYYGSNGLGDPFEKPSNVVRNLFFGSLLAVATLTTMTPLRYTLRPNLEEKVQEAPQIAPKPEEMPIVANAKQDEKIAQSRYSSIFSQATYIMMR